MMAGVKKQIKGTARETVGEVKKSAGKATGNRSLEAKGAADVGKGKTKRLAGRAAQQIKGAT